MISSSVSFGEEGLSPWICAGIVPHRVGQWRSQAGSVTAENLGHFIDGLAFVPQLAPGAIFFFGQLAIAGFADRPILRCAHGSECLSFLIGRHLLHVKALEGDFPHLDALAVEDRADVGIGRACAFSDLVGGESLLEEPCRPLRRV